VTREEQAAALVLVAVSDRDAPVDERGLYQRDPPIDGPARGGIGASEPRHQLRESEPTEIRTYPDGPAEEHHAGDLGGIRSLDEAGAGLVGAPAVEHVVGFLGERRLRPVVDAARLGHHDLAVVRFAGDPIGILGRQPDMTRLEDIDQRIPVAARHLEFVERQEILEVVAQAKPDPQAARELVAFDHEARQQVARTVLDGQRIGQP